MPKKIQMDLEINAQKGKAGVKDIKNDFKKFEEESLRYAKQLGTAWTTVNRKINMCVSAFRLLSTETKTAVSNLSKYNRELDSILKKQSRLAMPSAAAGAAGGGAAGGGVEAGTAAAIAAATAAAVSKPTAAAKKVELPTEAIEKVEKNMAGFGKTTETTTKELHKLAKEMEKMAREGKLGYVNDLIKAEALMRGMHDELRKINFEKGTASFRKFDAIMGSIKTKIVSVASAIKTLVISPISFIKTNKTIQAILTKTKQVGMAFKKWVFSPLKLNNVKKDLRRIKKLAKDIWGWIKKWGTIAAIAGISILTYKFGKALLQAADKAEQLRMRLVALTQDAETGRWIFDELAKYAATVPFEFEKILMAATNLTGVFQGNAQKALAWMPIVSDLAAATGISIEETMSQIIRMYSAGARAADLFRERGVIAMLGFEFGKFYSPKETEKILMKVVTDTNNMFYQMSNKLATTWSGVVSMLIDKWFLFRLAIMDSGPFNVLKDMIFSINDALNQAMIIDPDKGFSRFEEVAFDTAKFILETMKLIAGATYGVVMAISALAISFQGLRKSWNFVFAVIRDGLDLWGTSVRKVVKWIMIGAGEFDIADALERDIMDIQKKNDEYAANYLNNQAKLDDSISSWYKRMQGVSDLYDGLVKKLEQLQKATIKAGNEAQINKELAAVKELLKSMSDRNKRWDELDKAAKTNTDKQKGYYSELLELQGKSKDAALENLRVKSETATAAAAAVEKQIKAEKELLNIDRSKIMALPPTDNKVIEEGRRILLQDTEARLAAIKQLEDSAQKERLIRTTLFEAERNSIIKKHAQELLDFKNSLDVEYLNTIGAKKDAEILALSAAYEKDREAYKEHKDILLALETNFQEKMAEIREKYRGEELAKEGDWLENFTYGMEQAKKELESWGAVWQRVGKEISDVMATEMTAAIWDFIEGTKTAAQAIQDMARSVLKWLSEIIIKWMLLKAIQASTGWNLGGMMGMTGLQEGGYAQAGKPYIVGEKGPELFVPGGSGTVVPNKSLTGAGPQTQDIKILLVTDQMANQMLASAEFKDAVKMNVQQNALTMQRQLI